MAMEFPLSDFCITKLSLSNCHYYFGFPKREIGSAWNFERSSVAWHWRAIESLGQNWIVASNSVSEKIGEFLLSGTEDHSSFFVKGKLVEPKTFTKFSSSDTEGPWKVWWKTDSWFPVQHTKKLRNSSGVGQRFKISGLISLFFVKGRLVEPKTFTKVLSSNTEGTWKV